MQPIEGYGQPLCHCLPHAYNTFLFIADSTCSVQSVDCLDSLRNLYIKLSNATQRSLLLQLKGSFFRNVQPNIPLPPFPPCPRPPLCLCFKASTYGTRTYMWHLHSALFATESTHTNTITIKLSSNCFIKTSQLGQHPATGQSPW